MDKDYYLRMRLDGRIALVTGAGRGLGKWISKGLARAGADVAVAALHTEGVSRTAREIERMHQRACPLQVDLTRIDSIETAVKSSTSLLRPVIW